MYNFVGGKKVLGDMKYLMRSVKQSSEEVGIGTEDNWDVKIVNSLYTMITVSLDFKRKNRFDSLS